ncbi:MAG: polysaccharide deacetylase family protein [Desulfitobacteriaceae bacterium]
MNWFRTVRPLGVLVFSGILVAGSPLISGCSAVSQTQVRTGAVVAQISPSPVLSSPGSAGGGVNDLKEAFAEKALQIETHWPVTETMGGENPQPTDGQAQDSLNTLEPVPAPDPAGTPIHPFYEAAGAPPTAPGLAMRHRIFSSEPTKIVYLTIDDGPYPETTPKVLEILREEKVHATFFVVGRQAERYPDLLKAEYDQGNAIGNHTYSHEYAEIYPSPETFLANIKKGEEVIFKILGIRPEIIRVPGGTQGHFHIRYYNAVDAAGYVVFDWNVSTGDTTAPLVPTEQLVRNVMNQMVGRNRAILLMHDIGTKKTSVEALPRIIKYLKSQGYSFGILSSHVAPVLFPGGFAS